jgi:hypothetical protein
MTPTVKVAAICLTADRPMMTARVVKCFLEQTYPAEYRTLYILDSGETPIARTLPSWRESVGIKYFRYHNTGKIGELRNVANEQACINDVEVLMHWDSDDWYAPAYMASQVARLDSDICAVGFNSVLFYDCLKGEAWRYDHSSMSYGIGASLTYWASCWKKIPFEPISAGEDTRWLRLVKSRGFSGVAYDGPEMIATLHSSNTASQKALGERNLAGNHNHWTRLPEWDAYAAKVLEIK